MRHTITDDTEPSFRAVLIGLSLAYLLLQIPFLDQVPPIVIDEPWYGNTAHNLANGRGLINTNAGGMGGDQFFGYPLILAGAFKVFGTSLWIGRFVSVLMGLVALWGLGFACRKLAIRGWPFAVTGVLFIISNVYFILFRRLRPEALVIVLSVWALYFFLTAWQTGNFGPALACALLVGGSAMAHPNGALLAVLLGTLLTARALSNSGGARSVLGYATGGGATILIFLIGRGLLRDQSVFEFLEWGFSSRHHSLSRDIASAFWINLTTFFPIYSLGLKRLYVLVFELGILLVGLARYRHDRLAGLLSLTALLWFVVGLVLWTPLKPSWVFSIVLMFSLTVTGRLLSPGVTTISPRGLKTLWLATLLYGLNSLAGDAYVLQRNATNTPYTRLTQTLDATIPDGVPVLTHIEFWFALQNNPVYIPVTRWSTTPYAGLRELLESGDVRYAVLSDALAQGLSPTTGQQKIPYKPIVDLYREAHTYALGHCQRITVVPTHGYGEIEIWECPPRP